MGSMPARGEPTGQSPFSIGNERPSIAVPDLACDSHIHIFDPAFAPSNANFKALIDDATPAQYRKYQRRIGTQRVVVVTPSTYGIDNRATLSGLAAFGAAARGVIVVDAFAPPADLKEMSERGVRGIRVNFVSAQSWGPTTVERLEKTAALAVKLGWHIQIYATGQQIADMEAAIARLPTPVVIDHLGSIGPAQGLGSPGHRAMLKLLASRRVWVKLSGPYIVSEAGPLYRDVDAIARSYVEAAPDRVVWGSDWPHRNRRNPFPDDALLIDALARWVPDPVLRKRVLVDNPAALYGF